MTGPKPTELNAGRVTAMKSSTFPEGDGNTKHLVVLLVYPKPSLRACAVRKRGLQPSCSANPAGIANQCAKRNGFLYRNAVPLLNEIVF